MKKTVIALMLVLALSAACLMGCGQTAAAPGANEPLSLADGGTLILSVNPKIAIAYDAQGVVTGIIARNDDALAIVSSCKGLIGQQTKDVVNDLVVAIGEAGYFVEEFEGEGRQITLEIEPGSALPSEQFLDDVAAEIQTCVASHDWTAPLVVEIENKAGVTDFGEPAPGVTDYIDTDYGPNSDGVTDYKETDYGPAPTEVAPTEPAPSKPAPGVTDYDDTDYGPNNDGVTDYDDTDYGPNSDGVTDYDDTDYGPAPTEAAATEPAPSKPAPGTTDYGGTDYGPDNDGVTDYNEGVTDYDEGKTDYDDPSTDYGDSRYDGKTAA